MILDGVEEGIACLLVTQALEKGLIFESRKLLTTYFTTPKEEEEVPYTLLPFTSESERELTELEATE